MIHRFIVRVDEIDSDEAWSVDAEWCADVETYQEAIEDFLGAAQFKSFPVTVVVCDPVDGAEHQFVVTEEVKYKARWLRNAPA